MYEVLWFQEAVEALVELDSRQRRLVLTVVRTFGRHGKGDLKKLRGHGNEWRLRAGDWRARVILDGSTVFVAGVDNRRDAY